MTDEDPYLWLEDIDGEAALEWVAERNAETEAALAADAGFADLKERLREVLDASDRIPSTVRRGVFLYNFWQDAGHVRGVWRRTTLEQYRKDLPEWEVLLDIDALAAAEGEKWVWSGAQVRRPDYDRALVSLSRDGGDAVVVREFDLATRTFVEGGFRVGEAKTRIGWIDADTVFIGTDFGPGSLTDSRLSAHGTQVAPRHTAGRGRSGLRGRAGRCGGLELARLHARFRAGLRRPVAGLLPQRDVPPGPGRHARQDRRSRRRQCPSPSCGI